MKPRFLTAMGCYVVLALLAVYTLERIPRTIVLLFLAGLAVRTWIAVKRQS